MKLIFLTPGTGSYHCGVCMRDNALAKELVRQGHEALLLPMYLPLALDETSASPEVPIFYGGVSVYLQQKFALFRHTPRWLDHLLNQRWILKLAAKRAGMTSGAELGDLTVSMLKGEEGKQRKELDELVEFIRGEKPDAVWLSTALLAGVAHEISEKIGVPVLCSLQGEDTFLDSLPEPWRKQSWETLAERAEHIAAFVAPSRYYADFMTPRLRLRADQLHVIPNGISLEGFEEPANPEQPPVIGFLARFIAGKGLGFVVDAFIRLKQRGRFPNVRLRCAGTMIGEDEPFVAELKAKLASAGLERDAEFLPNVSREEKVTFLRSLTMLSVPTNYGEAFGLYVIEAMAAGVPVVQPLTAAFPEIIEATGGGLLFEAGDAEALADAWERLLVDPTRARQLGERGRAVVHAEYSMARMTERFLELTRAAAALAGASSSR